MISKWASKREVYKSNKAIELGIDNMPNKTQRHNLYKVCRLFDLIRTNFGVPIGISSGFRSVELNEAIGGASNSQHCALNGAALDIDADIYGRVTNKEIFEYILRVGEFDQVIYEFPDISGEPAWIHVSYNTIETNRREALVAYKSNGRTKYVTYDYWKSKIYKPKK